MILARCIRSALDVRAARDELRDVRAAYEAMRDRYRQQRDTLQATLARLEGATRREESLREYVNLVELERDDARREVDEVRAALCWLERDFKVGGGS